MGQYWIDVVPLLVVAGIWIGADRIFKRYFRQRGVR